jgi:NAD kinase
VVLVTRRTDFEVLLAEHATFEQARFFLKTRGQDIEATKARHDRFVAVLARVAAAIPAKWRRARVERADVNRFLFEPSDVVVAVGQDGLVANVAKYLDGQAVIGINPEPERHDGVLVSLGVDQATPQLLEAAAAHRADCEVRSMVEARLDDGQRLLALNEVFVGHRTHQSARYRIAHRGEEELQSSSGVVVSTGTGATGWARSICRGRETDVSLPGPEERRVAFFVREAFPSLATGTAITEGDIGDGDALEVTSRMNGDGVIFGDGIEADRLAFAWGCRARVGLAEERLHLVRG